MTLPSVAFSCLTISRPVMSMAVQRPVAPLHALTEGMAQNKSRDTSNAPVVFASGCKTGRSIPLRTPKHYSGAWAVDMHCASNQGHQGFLTRPRCTTTSSANDTPRKDLLPYVIMAWTSWMWLSLLSKIASWDLDFIACAVSIGDSQHVTRPDRGHLIPQA